MIACIGFSRGSLYDFPCSYTFADMKGKMFDFAHFP